MERETALGQRVGFRLVWVLLAGGCASGPGPGDTAVRAVTESVPPAIHWTRSSAEHRAILHQTYRLAGERIRDFAEGRARGTWVVILDADETVLDNSTYQKERAAVSAGFSAETWSAWIRRREATALPGAASFIGQVRGMGGRVAIVTNRTAAECGDTRANLDALGIEVDVVLCRPEETSDKNPRFAALRNGTAVPGLPPLEVLMWVGDNVQDFPSLDQNLRLGADSAFVLFGSRYIILPNPMYGSWERNPVR